MSQMMSTILRISRKDRVQISKIDYTVHAIHSSGYVFVREIDPEIKESFTYAEVWNRFLQGSLKIFRNVFDENTARLRLIAGCTDLAGLSKAEELHCLYAARCCDRLIELQSEDQDLYPRTRKGYAAAAEIIAREQLAEAVTAPFLAKRSPKAAPAVEMNQERRARAGDTLAIPRPPTGRKLEKWLKLYEAHDCHPLALRNAYWRCGRSESPLQTEVQALIRTYSSKYLDEGRPSGAKLYRDMVAEIEKENLTRGQNKDRESLIVPSIKVLRKAIRRLPPFTTLACRKGVKAAEIQFGIVTRGVDAMHPGARVELDESKLPLVSMLKASGVWEQLTPHQQAQIESVGRLWIVSAIDVATDVILGFVLSRETSSQAVLDVMSLATRDKTSLARSAGCLSDWFQHCGMDTIGTDAGGALLSEQARSGFLGLGAKHLVGPVGRPGMRGTKERFFRTVNLDLLSGWTGQTFANPVDRGDYESETRVSRDGETLALDIVRWLIDIHHLSPHAGLRGETPLDAWRRLASTVGIVPAPDENTRRTLFGLRILRKPGPHGVRVLGSDYQSSQLQEHLRNSSDVPADGLEISVDPFDLGAVSVRLGRTWIAVSAMDETLRGVPLTVHAETMAALRARYGEQARLHAHIVHAARRDLMERNQIAVVKAALGPTRPTARALDRAEHGLAITIVGIEHRASVDAGLEPNAGGQPLTIPTGSALDEPEPPMPEAGHTLPTVPSSEPRKPRWTVKDQRR